MARQSFYFAAGAADRTVYGHVWKVWAHGTSFYLAARHASLNQGKFSLHGEDPRPGLSPVYRFRLNRDALGVISSNLPMELEGRPHGSYPDGILVIRFRYRSSIFQADTPFGIGYDKLPNKAEKLYVPVPPAAEHVADLDFYVCSSRPTLSQAAIAADAVIGPITNESGDWLVGFSHRRRELADPTPLQAGHYGDMASPRDSWLRGVWIGQAGCQFAWVVETLMSRESYTREAETSSMFMRDRSPVSSDCVASTRREVLLSAALLQAGEET